MDQSILNNIKKLLGIDESDTSYDVDIIIHINTTIPILSQIGVKPPTGFMLTSKNQVWQDYIGTSTINLESVKTYIYLRVKLLFDPPTNPTTVQSMTNTIKELEWRIMLDVETNNLEV